MNSKPVGYRLETSREVSPYSDRYLARAARLWDGGRPIVCADVMLHPGDNEEEPRVIEAVVIGTEAGLDEAARFLATEIVRQENLPPRAIDEIIDAEAPVASTRHREHFILEARPRFLVDVGGTEERTPIPNRWGVIVGNFDPDLPIDACAPMVNLFTLQRADRDGIWGAGDPWMVVSGTAHSAWPGQGVLQATYDLVEKVSGIEMRPHGWNGLSGMQGSIEIYTFWKKRLAERGIDADVGFDVGFHRGRVALLREGKGLCFGEAKPLAFFEDLDRHCAERIAAFHARRDPGIPIDVQGWRTRHPETAPEERRSAP